jgi:non-ribosomal peptide synthetase component F
VTPGSIVAVLVLRSPLMVATLLGVLKAGAGYLPLDHHHPEGRIAFMLEDAAVKVSKSPSCMQAGSQRRVALHHKSTCQQPASKLGTAKDTA